MGHFRSEPGETRLAAGVGEILLTPREVEVLGLTEQTVAT